MNKCITKEQTILNIEQIEEQVQNKFTEENKKFDEKISLYRK